MAKRVLLAEDEANIAESISFLLQRAGFEVTVENDGRRALDAVMADAPDVLVLDVMLPGLDGYEILRKLRVDRRGETLPVLMLTARHTIGDRVEGLDAGADDYLVKPFSLDELFARIRALLRRTSLTGEPSGVGRDVLRVGDLELDRSGRTVSRAGQAINLTKTEFDLLELLVHNAGIVLSRDLIYERVWGYDFETGSKSLDVYIGYLRRKLEADGSERLVHTVRGVDYVVRRP